MGMNKPTMIDPDNEILLSQKRGEEKEKEDGTNEQKEGGWE